MENGQRYIKVIPVITVLFPYGQDIMMFVIFGKRSTLYKSDSRNNCSISLWTRYNDVCNIWKKGQRYIKVIPVITVPFPYGQDIMMFVIFGKGQR